MSELSVGAGMGGASSIRTETWLQCGADGRRRVFIRLLLCGRRCSRHRVTEENKTKVPVLVKLTF